MKFVIEEEKVSNEINFQIAQQFVERLVERMKKAEVREKIYGGNSNTEASDKFIESVETAFEEYKQALVQVAEVELSEEECKGIDKAVEDLSTKIKELQADEEFEEFIEDSEEYKTILKNKEILQKKLDKVKEKGWKKEEPTPEVISNVGTTDPNEDPAAELEVQGVNKKEDVKE